MPALADCYRAWHEADARLTGLRPANVFCVLEMTMPAESPSQVDPVSTPAAPAGPAPLGPVRWPALRGPRSQSPRRKRQASPRQSRNRHLRRQRRPPVSRHQFIVRGGQAIGPSRRARRSTTRIARGQIANWPPRGARRPRRAEYRTGQRRCPCPQSPPAVGRVWRPRSEAALRRHIARIDRGPGGSEDRRQPIGERHTSAETAGRSICTATMCSSPSAARNQGLASVRNFAEPPKPGGDVGRSDRDGL